MTLGLVTGWLRHSPGRVLAALCAVCLGLLTFGLYLQHVVGLNPCPMCIVQRYALFLVAIMAGLTSLAQRRSLILSGIAFMLTISGFGAFVAARQSWLQWYPPEVSVCGRDLYGMIEMFPLQRVIPMVFKGSGDCTAIDWTFLGGSIANWSFMSFMGITVLSLALLWQQSRAR